VLLTLTAPPPACPLDDDAERPASPPSEPLLACPVKENRLTFPPPGGDKRDLLSVPPLLSSIDPEQFFQAVRHLLPFSNTLLFPGGLGLRVFLRSLWGFLLVSFLKARPCRCRSPAHFFVSSFFSASATERFATVSFFLASDLLFERRVYSFVNRLPILVTRNRGSLSTGLWHRLYEHEQTQVAVLPSFFELRQLKGTLFLMMPPFLDLVFLCLCLPLSPFSEH